MTHADETFVSPDTIDLAPATQEREPLDLLTGEPLASEEEAEDQLALRNLERKRAEKRRKKHIKIIACCAVAFGLLAVIVGRHVLAPAEAEEEVPLETAFVERGDFESVINATGALKAGSTMIVTPEVDGTIESISVNEGQEVKEGEVLFTLKNDSLDKAVRDAQQEVTSAQQAVSSAQSDVASAQAARDEAWNRYNRAYDEAAEDYADWAYLTDNYDRLHREWQSRRDAAAALACGAPQDPGAAPTDDTSSEAYRRWQELKNQFYADTEAYKAYQDALSQVGDEPQPAGIEPTFPEAPEDSSLVAAIQNAEAGVTSAQTALQKANEAYDEAVKDAEKRIVKAPADGNVVAVSAKVGQSVGGARGGVSDGSSSEALVQISNVNTMAIDIEVNEIDILNVKKGQWAKVTFSAVPGVEVDAQVSEVATVASGTGGEGGGIVTFHVGLVIPHPDDQLRPGMSASVRILTADVKDALIVPTSAISEGVEGTSVEVVLDEETMETETRPVVVGARDSSQAVIEEGLAEGELILAGIGSFGDDEWAMG